MTVRTIVRGIRLVLLVTLAAIPVMAQEIRQPSTSALPAASSGDKNLENAQARIAELEAQVAELRAALVAKEKGAVASPPAASPKADPGYDVNAADEKYRFLNLGVRRRYIAAERNRLVDQLHTMIPPLYEPAFSPFHGYTLPPHAFRVSIDADRFINNHDFGRDSVYARFFDNVKVENQHLNADLFYGLDENTTLRVTLPFRNTNISGTGKAFRIIPMVMTMNGKGFGIGDLQVMVKRKWFDQSTKHFNFATVIGVQFPTGKHDSRFNDAQTLTMNGMPMPVSASSGGPKVDLFSDDLRIPNSAQPGTGSWGIIFGAMGTRQLTWNRLRGAIHAGAMYKTMKNNAEGVRPGNELVFATSFVQPPFRSELLGEHFTFDLTFMGRNKQSERYPGTIMHPDADANGMPIMNSDGSLKMFITSRPPFEHGTVMFFSPSLVIIPKSSVRLVVSPLIRIHEPLRGPSPAVRMVFGITTTF